MDVTDSFLIDPKQERSRLPVLFTSHGNPMDIPLNRKERPYWQSLYELGKSLRENYPIKATLVVSAHWNTRGTFVQCSREQKQIFDYYGFPDEYYQVYYSAKGAPDIAKSLSEKHSYITATEEWGLDHGSWPVLMHLFPDGDMPVFQLSLDMQASPAQHFSIGERLKELRDEGILVIGSGSLIHNLQLAMRKFQARDFSAYGWEAEYEEWIKTEILKKQFNSLLEYGTSHPKGKLASPTPEHFVPVLYTLGMLDSADEIRFFNETRGGMPAFSELSFIAGER